MPRGTDKLLVYESVATRIEDLILARALLPGERIPSVRKMHRDTGASVTSVLQAYYSLEYRGLIRSHPQSGFYVLPHLQHQVSIPKPAESASFKEEIDEYVIQSFVKAVTDPKALQLAEATPCPELLPFKNLSRILGKICRDTPEKIIAFEDPQGNLELRRQISRLSLDNRRFEPREIIVTNGGYESWNLCLRSIAERGDRILIDSATYFGVREIFKSLGIVPVEMPSHSTDGVDLSRVNALLKKGKIKGCFVLPQFGQPFSGEWRDEIKQQFVMAFSRYQVPIIEADVYRDFYFGSRPPSRLKDYDEKGIVIHCGSFSKTVSAGFRLAWLVPGVFKEQILRLKFISSISAPTLSQLAVAEYLARGSLQRHLRIVRRKLLENLAIYTNAIARSFPEGTRISQPEGGYALWIQLPAQVDSVKVFKAALKKNIVVAPGPIFSTSGEFRSLLRISFAQSWSSRVQGAIAELAAIVNQLHLKKR